MKIIDAHIHLNSDPYFSAIARAAGHENSPEHLRQVYAQLDIRHAVVMGNRDLDLARHQYPPFASYCVGLDGSYFQGEHLQRSVELVRRHLARKSCVGIKLYPGYMPYYVSDPAYSPFIELAREFGKPVAVHTGQTATGSAWLKYSHPLTLDDVATAYPDVQFVMCHLGNPWLVDAAAVLSKNKNVAADLSGLLEGMVDVPALLQKSSGYLEHIKTWLGYIGDYERILYGTDWPLTNIPAYIAFVAHLIPEQHHDKVFFENANRIYKLGL